MATYAEAAPVGLSEREVGGADGLALGSVSGGGEGELDVLADVPGRQRALARAPSDQDAAVVADPGHGPGVAVGHPEVAVVAAGGDSVAETDSLTTARDGLTRPHTSLLTSAPSALTDRYTSTVAAVADGCVERPDLVAGVGDDEQVTLMSTVGADGGQGRGALDLAGMANDLAACMQLVEDLTGTLPSAHEQAEVGVRGIAEPVHRLELVVRCGSHPACGEVEDAAATHRR